MGKTKITGIILAGGKSSRMGAEKGLIPFKGKPMIEYAIEALSPFCDEILISANTLSYNFLGFEVIKDEIPNSGPMGGIYSCMKHSKNELNFVLTCDMPLVTPKIVSQIIDCIDNYEVVIPCHGGEYFEPLCAVYHKNILPEVEKFIQTGNFKIPDLIKNVKTFKIMTGIENGLDQKSFFSVNSKADMNKLLRLEKDEGINNIPNLLMIAGTGRKVGKTTFACALISSASQKHEVVGIKISPHLHHQTEGQKILHQNDKFLIIEETNPDSEKDSSRMLRAGATKVYYLQTIDKNIREPFVLLLNLIHKHQAVICESGALLEYAKPGIFLLVKRKGQTSFKKGLDLLPYAPDSIVEFDDEGFNPSIDTFSYTNGVWKKKESTEKHG